MDSLSQSVTREIRAEMARQYLSGQQLADKLRWQPKYLSRRLTGAVSLSLDDLEEIAAALGVPVWSLLGSRLALIA